MAALPPPQPQQARALFDPRVATKDEFVAKFNQMSRVIKAQKQRIEEVQGTCDAHERNIQQLQTMLRQAAEDKEAAIKMRAALQAELAQKHPRPYAPCAAPAVATSEELQRGRMQLETWAVSQTIYDVMQRVLDDVCQQPPPASTAFAMVPVLEPGRVLEVCVSMACASELLLQPASAATADSSRSSQQAMERNERAAAHAVAARDAALKQNAHIQEVCDTLTAEVKNLKIDLERRTLEAAALRSHASECAAEAERAQRSALQSDAVHAASSAEEVAQLREQVIRCEKCLQDERHLLRAQREEAAANAQKHDDAMRQMGGRLGAAADAAAAAESRAQACERDAAARALQDESIMRDVRSSMAGQLHALTSKLADAQRVIELQHQADCQREQVASAAAAASAASQREWFTRLANIASGLMGAALRLTSDVEDLRASRERLRLLLEPERDKSAPTPQQQDAVCQCLRDVSSVLSKLGDDDKGDTRSKMSRGVAEDDAALPGVQELEAEDSVAATHFCTVFGLDVPLQHWFQSLWTHPSNPLLRFSASGSPSAYSPLST